MYVCFPVVVEMTPVFTEDQIDDRLIQCYWHVPVFITHLLELLIFLLLGLSGLSLSGTHFIGYVNSSILISGN